MDNGKLKLKTVPVAELKASPYNPRKITPSALDGLTRSIETFGMVEPIIVNTRSGQVVGGHQRLEALKRLGIEETPVVEVDLDDTNERALNLALNNPGLQGSFSDDVTALLMELKSHVPEDVYSGLRYDDIYTTVSPELVPDFAPVSADEQSRLDQKALVICPECGHEFAPSP